MTFLAQRLDIVRQRIRAAEQRYGRVPGTVQLLAVSKTFPVHDLIAAHAAGQRTFGESYLQEALPKIAAMTAHDSEWHYIGGVQTNKTRGIAEHFAWVHSVDRLAIAQRLNAQRPAHLPPLNICLQVRLADTPRRAGAEPATLPALAAAIAELPRVRLRGIMAIPAASNDFTLQYAAFHRAYEIYDMLRQQGFDLDTLSMGMSHDLEAAIAAGATWVRVGSAIFGTRV